MGKYIGVYCQDHPRRTKQGVVYQHILVAEGKLGRTLKPGEFVHHIDFDKHNNSPENIIVFASNGDHARFHRLGCPTDALIEREDGSYSCASGTLDSQVTVCRLCGSKKSLGSQMCLNCRNALRAASIPQPEELLNALERLDWNFCAAGRFYGVTDNAVRKWCKKYKILPM